MYWILLSLIIMVDLDLCCTRKTSESNIVVVLSDVLWFQCGDDAGIFRKK